MMKNMRVAQQRNMQNIQKSKQISNKKKLSKKQRDARASLAAGSSSSLS